MCKLISNVVPHKEQNDAWDSGQDKQNEDRRERATHVQPTQHAQGVFMALLIYMYICQELI